MTYIYILTVGGGSGFVEYFASLEGVSKAAYEVFTDYLDKKEIPYDREAILSFVSPTAISKSLADEETIYNKHHVTVLIIAQGAYTLHVSFVKLHE
jgi:hypothetical protein